MRKAEDVVSAYLDKSQGITFIYTGAQELLARAKSDKLDSPFLAERAALGGGGSSRVIKARDAKAEPFQAPELKPGAQRTFPVPMGVREAEEKALRQSVRSVASLQKSLGELTDAQAKLRFLLQEIESLTKKKD